MSAVVLYHAKCPDGIGASYIFYRVFSLTRKLRFSGLQQNKKFDMFSYNGEEVSVQFIGINPSQRGIFSPDSGLTDETFRGKDVFFLDVMANEEDIKHILSLSRQIMVLDHHGDDNKETPNSNFLVCQRLSGEYENFQGIHSFSLSHGDKDKEKCGMELASECFCDARGGFQWAWLTNAIADRDKWTWKYAGSKELGEYLYTIGLFDIREGTHPFEAWDKIVLSSTPEIMMYIDYGKLLLQRKNKDIQMAVKSADKCILTTPSGKTYRIYFSNCDHNITSDVGNILATKGKEEGIDFAVCYRYNFKSNEWWLSLRSVGEFNTRLVAQEFGGEGHKNASGCSIQGIDELTRYFSLIL
jgi:hypothetical protein